MWQTRCGAVARSPQEERPCDGTPPGGAGGCDGEAGSHTGRARETRQAAQVHQERQPRLDRKRRRDAGAPPRDLDRPAWVPASTQPLEGPGRPAYPLFTAGTDPPLSCSRSVLQVRSTRQPGHAWQGPTHHHAASSFSGHVWKPARGGLTRRDCRTYYKATVIKTVWSWRVDRCPDQRRRTQARDEPSNVQSVTLYGGQGLSRGRTVPSADMLGKRCRRQEKDAVSSPGTI